MCPVGFRLALALLSTAVAMAGAAEETPSAYVLSLDVVGNRSLSDGSYRRALEIRPARRVRSPPPPAARFDEAQWPAQGERLVRHARDHGFLGAEVGVPQVTERRRTADARWVAVAVPVHEGPRYRVGDVRFEG